MLATATDTTVRADALLLADLRRRIEAVSPDTPQGWLERAMVYAPDRVRDELLAAGAVAPVPAGLLQIVRRRAFEVVDDAAQAILATLAEIRRHNDSVGGWYADD